MVNMSGMGNVMSGRFLALLAVAFWLGGCAAADTALNHRRLQVQTKMSETIYLDPVPQRMRTIFVGARNTSEHPELDLRSPLMNALANRGYQIVNDPDAAHYMLRVNVLQAGPVDPKTKEAMLSTSFGEPLAAGVGGALLSGMLGGNTPTAIGIGLGLALTTYLADQLIQDVTYSVLVDIQLSERPLNGGKVNRTTTSSTSGNHSSFERPLSPGPELNSTTRSSHGTTQYYQDTNDFKQYHTRAVAYADQMNLKFEEAMPLLLGKLTSSLSNLFE